jgi:YYY domain-containing protein
MFKKILYTALAVIVLSYGSYLLGDDFQYFVQWWSTILLLGLIYLPVTSVLFASFEDKGYIFSKAIGIAASGYIMWLTSSLHIMKFSAASCIISVLAGLLANAGIVLSHWLKSKKSSSKPDALFAFIKPFSADLAIKQELMFLAIFLIFSYIRGFKPEAYGTEKFMDYGFMTSMLRSDYMPPQDFWFSGTPLNYYYVGQFFAAYLTRLSFVKTAAGYNLMLMTIAAFAFMMPYSIVYHLLRFQYGNERCQNDSAHNRNGNVRYNNDNARRKKGSARYKNDKFNRRKVSLSRSRKDRKSRIFPHLGGLLAGAGVCIAGNMHYPVYKWFAAWWHKLVLKSEYAYRYWFPDATRYIGYQPETNDKTIHEFPAYSFVLGDLHAHVINVIFVLLVLGVLLAWMLRKLEDSSKPAVYGKEGRQGWIFAMLREIINPSIIAISILNGLFRMTNFWDYPIYYVVSGAVILFTNLIVYNFKGKAYGYTALQGLIVLFIGYIISLPFTLKFEKISAIPYLAENHTPAYQLLVLWGLPILTSLLFLVFCIIDFVKDRKVKAAGRTDKRQAWLPAFMKKLAGPNLYIITISLCAIGLVLIPEVIYIKDIYSGDYKRANTMFKLTYQAFIMFGICFGYIFVYVLAFKRALWQKLVTSLGLILFILTLYYPLTAVKQWYGNVFKNNGYEGLDATQFIKTSFPSDYNALRWLNDNVKGMPVVLEANGDSYSDYQRVSVITGLPTVLGWYNHEWLWKSNPEKTDDKTLSELNERVSHVETVYTSDNEEMVRSIIDSYDISYIYVGWLEERKYDNINHELIRRLGKVVYEDPENDTGRYRTYVVKVD